MTSDPVERFFAERSSRLNRRARLRTMTSTEIIDTAIKIYQQLGWTFLKATVVPALFVVAAFAFVIDYVVPSLFSTSDASNLSTQFGEVAVAVGLAILVGGPLVIVGVSTTTAIIAQLVSDFMLGNVPNIDASIRTARKTALTLIRVHFWEFLLACSGLIGGFGLSILSSQLDQVTDQSNVVAGVTAAVAMFSLSASGLIFLIVISRHALSAPVAVIEGRKPREASKRSIALLKGSGPIPSGYGNVWFLYLVIFLLTILVGIGLSSFLALVGFENQLAAVIDNLPFGALMLKGLTLVPIYLWVWTIVPVWATTITIIYYERRIRLEGYDIEALAADVWRNDRQARFEL